MNFMLYFIAVTIYSKMATHAEYRRWVGLYSSDMDDEKSDVVLQEDMLYDYPTFGMGLKCCLKLQINHLATFSPLLISLIYQCKIDFIII